MHFHFSVVLSDLFYQILNFILFNVVHVLITVLNLLDILFYLVLTYVLRLLSLFSQQGSD